MSHDIRYALRALWKNRAVAMGARSGDVLRLVLRQGLSFTLGGIAAGTIVATGVTRLLQSQLHGISSSDPITFAAVVLVLIGAATLASYVPARRAARTDPMEALRYE